MPFSVDYSPSERNLNRSRSNSLHWEMSIPDPDMRDRTEYLMHLDSMLDYDTVASLIVKGYGGFCCRFCFSEIPKQTRTVTEKLDLRIMQKNGS